MSFVGSNILAGASGQGAGHKIERSLRFNSEETAYLNRTPSSAGNRKTWTWSCWTKRTKLGVLQTLMQIYPAGTGYTRIYFAAGDNLEFDATDASGGNSADVKTTRVFRDPSAWYHIVVAMDTTQATAADRLKMYVNGVQETSMATATYPAQNVEYMFNYAGEHNIGRHSSGIQYLDGYLTNVEFVDGQALAPTEFGEFDTSNVWNPKQFEGTYNTTASFPSYPGVIISPSAVGGGSVSHVNGGGTYFYSQASSGAGSIKVEFSSPITGVTSIKYNGGGYSVNSAYNIRINGVDVFTNLSTNSSWAQASHTISSTDISSFEIYTANDGWSLYNLLFNDTSPSGTASLGTPAGVNGFHLDFSDNSSKAALGINTAPADDDYTPTVGALTTTQAADFYSVGSYPPNNLFDGSTSTIVYGGYDSTSTNSDLIWTPNGAYTVSSSLRVYAGYCSTIYVNGVSKATGYSSSSPGWITLNHTGSITSIKFENTANANIARAAAIEVDGTIVETTAWTVNNLTVAGSTWNQSQTWSSLGSGTAYNSNYVWANAFDGDKTVNSPTTFPAGSNTMTWIPSSPITVNTSVVVYVYNQTNGSSYGIKVNGSYLPGTNNYAVAVTRTAAQLSNQLTSIELVTASNLYGPYLAAVEVDGVLLVDSGVTDPALKDIDSLIDTPTDYQGTGSGNNGGNYATLNPLQNGGLTLSNGNLDVALGAGGWFTTTGTIGISSGKYYFEYTATTAYDNHMIGVVTSDVTLSTYLGNYASGWGYQSNGNKVHADSFVGSQPTANSGGDIIQVAVDMDAGKIWFGVNGTYIGSGNPSSGANPAYSNLSGTVFPAVSHAGTLNGSFNFGARDFSYTPPTSFVSICTTNLPEPTIADGSTAFDVKTFTANNGSQSISLGFAPDLVWTKSRAGAYNHQLFDILRGDDQELRSDTNDASRNLSNSLTFDSSGFTMPSNNNNANYGSGGGVAWAWDAGSSNTSVSAGGLNSSVYDQSATWSNFWSSTGNGIESSNPATASFDGVLTGLGMRLNGSSSATWTPTGGYSYSGDFLIYACKDNNYTGVSWTVVHAGGTTDITNSVAGGTTMTELNLTNLGIQSPITSISFTSNSQSNPRIAGMKAGGKILVDSGVSVTNVPTIASTVRANPSTGFSIVSYSGNGTAGATVGHGLNSKPDLILLKSRDDTQNWMVYHSALGATKAVFLSTTDSVATSNVYFNNTEPTSSVFSLGTRDGINKNSDPMIAYCFSEVSGYSSFGVYTGNGSADGPFVYTGFKPAFIIIKNTNRVEHWYMMDSNRDGFNDDNDFVLADSNDAEYSAATYPTLDILSNGFKIRGTHVGRNASSEDLIYFAFAEHPFKTVRAR